MNRKKTLKENFSWMFISNVIFGIFQWLILIVLTKIGTVEMVGIYTLGLAITAPIMLFSNLQLRAIQATDAKDENQFTDFFTLRLLCMILGMLITYIVIEALNYSINVKMIVLLIAASKAIEGLSDIVYGLIQKKEEMDKIAISLILRGILGFILFFIMLYFFNLVAGTIGMLIGWMLTLIFWDFKKVKEYDVAIKVTFNLETLKKLFITAIPLGVVAMLGSLNTNIPRYFIEYYLSIELLGIFGALSYVLAGANKFTMAISQTVSPRLAKYYANKEKTKFVKLFKKTMLINITFGLFGFLIIYLFGEEILSIIYSDKYADYYILFRWIMIVSLLNFVSSVFGVAITAMRIFKSQLLIHITKLILVVIFSLIFIKKLGLIGAALALIISSMISIIFYFIIFKKGLNRLEVTGL